MMSDEEVMKKKKHIKHVLNGLYVVMAFGVGLFIILLNVISRGGWFILLSILIGALLLFAILYILIILLSLFMLKQPETIILDEKDAEEKFKEKKIKEKGDGIHIRFGRTGK